LLCYSSSRGCSLITSITYFFFFNDTATTEIYTLSLHDALPICLLAHDAHVRQRLERLRDAAGELLAVDRQRAAGRHLHPVRDLEDRKSTRLNSSHVAISYAVFCLKKKKTKPTDSTRAANQ